MKLILKSHIFVKWLQYMILHLIEDNFWCYHIFFFVISPVFASAVKIA